MARLSGDVAGVGDGGLDGGVKDSPSVIVQQWRDFRGDRGVGALGVIDARGRS